MEWAPLLFLAIGMTRLLWSVVRNVLVEEGQLGRSELEKAAAFLRQHEPPFEVLSSGPKDVLARNDRFSVKVRAGIEGLWEDDGRGKETYVWREVFRIAIDSEALPKGIRFQREQDTGEDVLTGHPRFDDAVEVLGAPSVVLALFDAALRTSARQFVELGGRFAAGQIYLVSQPGLSYGLISFALGLAVDIAERLAASEGGGIYARLARNVREDPEAGVRLSNLLCLQEQFPLLAAARETSVAALDDESPWVRLSAARFLTHEGVPALKALLADESAPDEAAADAVTLLASRIPESDVGALLAPILKTHVGETQRRAIETLGRLHYTPAAGTLLVILERSNPRTAAAAAQALAALRHAAAEPALLHAAENDAGELRAAAVRALGEVGTVHAVEPLMGLLERTRRDAGTARSIRAAIAAIQARLAGAGAGQLALASEPDESGRLSLATPGPGRGDVTLVDPEG